MSLLAALDPRVERLSPLDASFLYLERPNELLHVGCVAVIDGPLPFDAVLAQLGARLGALRRYRQRPVRPPLDLRPPSWEDDPEFDPRHHVRRVQVPPPGDEAALRRLVDDLFPVPLDSRRPLWIAYLIEGLSGGRSALLLKVHHCMIDGVSGAQILEAITDGIGVTGGAAASRARRPPPLAERPGLYETIAATASPARVLATAREAVGAAAVLAGVAARPVAPLPFNGPLSSARRIVWTTFALDDVLAMRGAAACKVNDVVLAVIAGGLRRYLEERGDRTAGVRARALVPVNIRRAEEHLALGNRVSGMIATLPIGVADPIDRLRRITEEMRRHKEHGQQRGFDLALGLAGAAPAPLGALLMRLWAGQPPVNTVCTNVPGAREPRALLGRRVVDVYPIVPLAAGIGLAFAILSYAGRLTICATADGDLLPDAERIPRALERAVAELRSRLEVRAAAPAAPAAAAAARGGPTVADLMSRDVATLPPRAELAQAWHLMRTRRIRHLPVTAADGHVIGIVTHRDVLAASESTLAFPAERDRVRLLGRARVEDVMETHLSTAAPDEPAATAGRRMVRHKIGCLPVVAPGGHLVGIVTGEDFLAWAAAHLAPAPARENAREELPC